MKTALLFALLLLAAAPAVGQRIVFVDTEYILDHMKEYHDAQEQLEAIAADWRRQIDQMQGELSRQYHAFEAEQVLMTPEMKKQREAELQHKEQEIREFQNSKFGYQGELFRKRQELITPIQDKVYEAIKKMAQEKNYDVVLDKASGTSILYDNGKYDRSDDVLRILGLIGKTEEKK